jgi:hypothetical protein
MKDSFGVCWEFIDGSKDGRYYSPAQKSFRIFMGLGSFRLSFVEHIPTLKMRNKIVTHFSDPISLCVQRRAMFEK